MNNSVRAGILVLIVAALAACAAPPPAPSTPKTLVVLVPQSGGSVGAVSVKTKQGEALIDRPYASATAAGGAPVIGNASPSQVQQVFGAAINARPQPPVSYTLNFLEGRDEYTPESRAVFEAILSELGKRPTADIAVIGHTDRVGAIEYNDRLSLQRTDRVRADLIKRGVPERSISVAGRGEREPLVATADEVPEPRNRRVEINIR